MPNYKKILKESIKKNQKKIVLVTFSFLMISSLGLIVISVYKNQKNTFSKEQLKAIISEVNQNKKTALFKKKELIIVVVVLIIFVIFYFLLLKIHNQAIAIQDYDTLCNKCFYLYNKKTVEQETSYNLRLETEIKDLKMKLRSKEKIISKMNKTINQPDTDEKQLIQNLNRELEKEKEKNAQYEKKIEKLQTCNEILSSIVDEQIKEENNMGLSEKEILSWKRVLAQFRELSNKNSEDFKKSKNFSDFLRKLGY